MHVPTLADVMHPYMHYPKVIQQAILRIETHPSFSILTKSGKQVLKQLATRVNKTNGEVPIKARLDVVADRAGVSYKTVQRTIATLKKIGWIETTTDGRSEWGVFTSHEYKFSLQFCALANLPSNADKDTYETEMSDGTIVDLTFKKDHLEISKENQKQNPISLPADLREIANLGLKESGICKLRGLAHQAGHSLQDIWKIAKPRITEIGVRGGRIFSYLQKMILTPSDYKARAEQMDRIGTTIEKTNSVQWWKSASGITAKGKELGLVQTEPVFAHFRDRVLQAAGEGAWRDQVRTSAVQLSGLQRQQVPVMSELQVQDKRKSNLRMIKQLIGLKS